MGWVGMYKEQPSWKQPLSNFILYTVRRWFVLFINCLDVENSQKR